MKYVYACITYKCHREMEEVMKTIKYKKALDIANALRIENIVVDVCTSRNRSKKNLENILSGSDNIIVVSDLSSLGQKDEIAEVYQRIINSENDILICYYGKGGVLQADELSTVSLSFKKNKSQTVGEMLETLNALTTTQFRKTSTRVLDPNIIEAYWQVEKGLKKQVDVIKDLKTSKSTFTRRAEEYLYTDDWYEQYDREIDTSDIAFLPTRIGEVSDDSKKFYEYFIENPDDRPESDKQLPIEVAASFAGIDKETWEKIVGISDDKDKEDKYNFLMNRYRIKAIHLYREVLRYEKYLKRLKYRQ